MNLYDVARHVTDEVMGKGTYAEVNKNNPDPDIQAAILRGHQFKLPEVPTRWEMYTNEGDEAVTAAVRRVAAKVQIGEVTKPSELVQAVIVEVFEADHGHPEVSDTEPRCHLEDWMEEVCRAMEWDIGIIEQIGL